MAKISYFLGKPVAEAIPWICDAWPIYDYDGLIWPGWRKSCLLTCENEPFKWWFYNDDGWWYVISANAIFSPAGEEWLRRLWQTIFDAMCDAGVSKDWIDICKRRILKSIEDWIKYSHNLYLSRRSKSLLWI